MVKDNVSSSEDNRIRPISQEIKNKQCITEYLSYPGHGLGELALIYNR